MKLDEAVTQAEFGALVGVSQQAISDLMRSGLLPSAAPVGELLLVYCGRLREAAAGRGSDGELDLVQERARLAREQRISQALKNAVSRREYAPVPLLTEVLAAASQSIAAKLEALPGVLRRACPDLPDEALELLAREVARARNDWVLDTAKLEVRSDEGVSGSDDVDEFPSGDEVGA